MKPTVSVNLTKPHAGQLEVLKNRKRFNVLANGRRWGKTALVEYLIAETYLQSRGTGRFGVYSYTLAGLSDIWKNVLDKFDPLVTEYRSQPIREILLKGGFVVQFWSLARGSQPSRGKKYHRVAIDEAAFSPDLRVQWEGAIRPTLTDYRGDAYFLSSPNGFNYFFELYNMAQKHPEWMSWRKPTYDNPYIDRAEVESIRAEVSPFYFQQEYLAEFVDNQNSAIKREWIRYGSPPRPLPVAIGVDVAISERDSADYTALAAVSRDPKTGEIYVLDVYRFRASFQGTKEAILNFAAKHKENLKTIIVENVQYQSALIQELNRSSLLRIVGKRPDRDKRSRFGPFEAKFEQKLVYVDKNLPDYVMDELLTFPAGKHDDCVDALAYAYMGLEDIHKNPEEILVY